MSSLYRDGYPSPGSAGDRLPPCSAAAALLGAAGDVADNAKWQLQPLHSKRAQLRAAGRKWDTLPFLGLDLGAHRESLACPVPVTGTTAAWWKRRGEILEKGDTWKMDHFLLLPQSLQSNIPQFIKLANAQGVWVWQVTPVANSSELTKYSWRGLWVGWRGTATAQPFPVFPFNGIAPEI